MGTSLLKIKLINLFIIKINLNYFLKVTLNLFLYPWDNFIPHKVIFLSLLD